MPKDSFSAEERFDSDGPGSDDGSVRPGIGVCIDEDSPVWAGVGIWRMAGVPFGMEGTGEPSLAIEPARTDCESAGEVRPESREDEGTACGFEGERSSAILGCVCYQASSVSCRSFGYLRLTSRYKKCNFQISYQ